MRIAAWLVLTVLTTAASAHADVVDMPPTDCIPGSRGFTCHGGTGCEPSECMLDADCRPGEHCALGALCVGSFDCYWSGPQPIVTGPCAAGGTCAAGSACVQTQLCLPGAHDAGPAPVDAAVRPDAALVPDAHVATDSGGMAADTGDGRTVSVGGCGCGVGARGGLGAWLAVLAVVALRTRRARR